jgi:prepilin-type N-terminal cleavage/methylation domain-containing protein
VTRQRGFSLVELVVALVIAGIIGVALTRLVINQARFTSTQDGMMRARSTARAALNALSSELRMVTDSGLLAASRESITVRVPYVFGITCGYSGGSAVIGLFPVDSVAYATATSDGYAWRNTFGTWTNVQPASASGASAASCTGASPAISLPSVPGSWSATAVSVPKTGAFTPPYGSLVYFYQVVTFRFGASTELPGRVGLWRQVRSTGVQEELLTPFDTNTHFEFLVGSAQTVQTSAPAVLDSVAGVRLRLLAASENAPQGRLAPIIFNLTALVLFRNHVL